MAVRTKNRRKIKVRDRNFVWYIAEDRDSGDLMLHVVSEDKHFVVNYRLGQLENRREIRVIGREFPRFPDASASWQPISCPQWEENGIITPLSVRRLIDWCFAARQKNAFFA